MEPRAFASALRGAPGRRPPPATPRPAARAARPAERRAAAPLPSGAPPDARQAKARRSAARCGTTRQSAGRPRRRSASPWREIDQLATGVANAAGLDHVPAPVQVVEAGEGVGLQRTFEAGQVL